MSTRSWVLSLVLVWSCNSTALHIERKSSGAVERDPFFDPVKGADGHYISFPAYPFVNCTDALVPAELQGSPSALHAVTSGALRSADPDLDALVGVTPCESSRRYVDFQGYAREHIDATTCTKAQASWMSINKDKQQRTLQELANEYCLEGSGTTWPASEFSFVQLSDVQIREPNAKLGSSKLSRRLKHVESSFEQDYEQEQYAMFVYDAVIETINKEIDLYARLDKADTRKPWQRDRIPPQLMIHTGDSVDMGLRSEFDTFVTYTDKLKVPWYQAVGNHDVLAFGNLTLAFHEKGLDDDDPDTECNGAGWDLAEQHGVHCTCTSLAALIREENARRADNRGALPDLPEKIFSLFPILVKRICIVHKIDGDRFVMDPYPDEGRRTSDRYPNTERYPLRSFIDAHNASFNDAVLPAVRSAYARSTNDVALPCAVPGKDEAPKWGYHGFNLEWQFDAKWDGTRVANDAETRRLGGYYCFQMGTLQSDPNRKIWGVVLNTTIDAGAYGEVGNCQQRWLESVLGETPTGSPVADCPFNTASKQIGQKDLAFVFSHHPLWSIYDRTHRERLIRTITTSPNVVAMFTGHTHHPELRVQWPLAPRTTTEAPGHPVWEVIAASLIDYPQQGRQITLKTSGDLGYFEILSFSPVGDGPSAEKVRAAERGAIRDKCELQPELCEGPGRIRLPGRNVTFPRIFFRMPGAAVKADCRVPQPRPLDATDLEVGKAEAPECTATQEEPAKAAPVAPVSP